MSIQDRNRIYHIVSIALIVISIITLVFGWEKLSFSDEYTAKDLYEEILDEAEDEMEDLNYEERSAYRQVIDFLKPFKDGRISPIEVAKVLNKFIKLNNVMEDEIGFSFDDLETENGMTLMQLAKTYEFFVITWIVLIIVLGVILIMDKKKSIVKQWFFFGAQCILIIAFVRFTLAFNKRADDFIDLLDGLIPLYIDFGLKITIVPFIALISAIPFNYYEKIYAALSRKLFGGAYGEIKYANSGSVCPQCKSPVKSHYRFCLKCGYDLQTIPQNTYCPVCGASIDQGMAFCGKCGTKVGQDPNIYIEKQ